MFTLSGFLDAIDHRRAPGWLRGKTDAVAATYDSFVAYQGAQPRNIYGTDTLPGHRNKDSWSPADHTGYQNYLIDSHCIGGAPWLDPQTTRHISLAKAAVVAAGNVPLSGGLFTRILDVAGDPAFVPRIPANASYSSGDVIPAAHWARAMVDHTAAGGASPLGAGEGMALINGAFVHIGTMTALCGQIATLWPLYLATQRISLSLMQADRRAFALTGTIARPRAEAAAAYVSGHLNDRPGASQDPVSIRGTLQSIEALTVAVEQVATETETHLNRPSGNPLFVTGPAQGDMPNASFLAPVLTIATSGLIDALLLTGWSSVQRLTHLLSGKAGAVPMDAGTSDHPIGLIQWPKNAQAKLERMRQDFAVRAFTTGSSTSYGIEDIWTHGYATAQSATEAVRALTGLLHIELYAALYAARAADAELPFLKEAASLLSGEPVNETGAQAVAHKVLENLGTGGMPAPFGD